jgi:hypothetical protein
VFECIMVSWVAKGSVSLARNARRRLKLRVQALRPAGPAASVQASRCSTAGAGLPVQDCKRTARPVQLCAVRRVTVPNFLHKSICGYPRPHPRPSGRGVARAAAAPVRGC